MFDTKRRGDRFLASVLPRLLLIGVGVVTVASAGRAADRPNIVWITAEDMSATLGCYGDDFATTPHLDALARESTRYTHAFATAPVCSPARACLINGLIAATQGTHAMRSEFPLPDEMVGFPKRLRDLGYYTTNNGKTDYNSAAAERIIAASWDESSDEADWRGRDPGQPFFAVFNLMTSHQSRTMVWPYDRFRDEVQSRLGADQIHDPADAPIPPYYPDTPTVRKTVARYYDCVTAMDAEVAAILERLERDGLADDTIVFFYSDHGSGMPRHKRVLFDSGTHVPMLIRFPEKYRRLASTEPGETDDRLVSFEDFGPTVLSLAGVPSLPDFIRGRPFLGPLDTAPREFVYGHRDRVDEAIDLARSVRSRDYLYIRNYMPHLSWNQPYAWGDQGELRHEFYALAESGNATPAQLQYVGSSRPREALFDCNADPLNLTNLIHSPDHREIARRHREASRRYLLESRDLGFVPEPELWRRIGDATPMAWAATRSDDDRDRLLEAASAVGSDDESETLRRLRDEDPAVRYWAAVACNAMTRLSPTMADALVKALPDDSAAVRIEAAGALARHGHAEPADRAFARLLESDDRTVLLHTARTIELLGEPRHHHAMKRLADRFESEPGDLAWFIRFSTGGYLRRVPDTVP